MKIDWVCSRCGKSHIKGYKSCVLCRRPKDAPEGWDIPQHDA
jgi:hypothetical protein